MDESCVWTAPYREAFEQLMRGPETVYFTRDHIELARTADESPWEPSDYIRIAVPNFDLIEVIFITEAVSLKDVHRNLRKENPVGLVLLGPVINRNSLPYLIVITTEDKIFAIDPRDERGIKFLKMALNDTDIAWCTSNVVDEADCLLRHYDINLLKVEAKEVACCSGLHIHLMLTMRNKGDWALKMYPSLVKRYKKTVRIESFETLVEIWLDINREDISYQSSQLQHLKTRPLSLTARNIILKRCVLVRKLAQSLNSYTMKEPEIMSRNHFDSLRCVNEDIRKVTLKVKEHNEENHEVDFDLLSHLDSEAAGYAS